MDNKTKTIFTSSSLIPQIAEDLKLQLRSNYKVRSESRITGGEEINISKNDPLAFLGLRIFKTVYLSPATNGKISCEVRGGSYGQLVLPGVIALIFIWVVIIPIIIIGAVAWGFMQSNKLTEEIFQMVQESATRLENTNNEPESKEKSCHKCGTQTLGAGFCPECGTLIS